jgi:ABC-type transporter Mla MlaB component
MAYETKREIDEFIVEEKDSYIEVKPKFTLITPEMEKKLIGFLNTTYFGVKCDIRLNLSEMKYIPSNTRLVILDFAKEMKKQSRKFYILGAPKSLVNFLKRFQLEGIIRLES